MNVLLFIPGVPFNVIFILPKVDSKRNAECMNYVLIVPYFIVCQHHLGRNSIFFIISCTSLSSVLFLFHLLFRHLHKSTVMDLQWNRNGNWLLTASRDHLIKVFDIRAMKEIQAFRGHKKEATGMALN